MLKSNDTNQIGCLLIKNKKNYDPVLWMGFNCLEARATTRRQFTFTTKFPQIPGPHFTDLDRMKGWIDLGATQWFWTRHLWIGNPALYPLGHCSIRANVQKSYHIYTYHKTCFNRVLLNIFYSKTFSIKINQVLTFENIRKLCLNKTTLRCFYSCFDKTHL